jgi:hypothetical protein
VVHVEDVGQGLVTFSGIRNARLETVFELLPLRLSLLRSSSRMSLSISGEVQTEMAGSRNNFGGRMDRSYDPFTFDAIRNNRRLTFLRMRRLVAVVQSLLLASTTVAAQGRGTIQAGSGSGTQTQSVGTAPVPKNSFYELTSHLDPGGNLFLYVSAEEWLNGLSGQVAQWRDLLQSLPNVSSSDQQSITRAADVILDLIRNSGVEEISGFGMSAISYEKGLYRSKTMLHHDKGNDAGYLWSLFGKTPHAFDAIEFLPANAAVATFTDLDLQLLWSVLQKEMTNLGIPGGRESLDSIPSQFARTTGVELARALESLGGEYGLVISIDESKTMPAPVAGTPTRWPDTSAMLIVKVKDDLIFDLVDSSLKGYPDVIRRDRTGVRMRVVPLHSSTSPSLRPAVARSGSYLFIATNDALIEAALEARTTGGLNGTGEFKHLGQGLPVQGNAFTFVSQRFGEMIGRLLSPAASSETKPDSERASILQSYFGAGTLGTLRVFSNTDEGWLTIGNTGQNPANTLFYAATALPLILATIAIPSVLRSRQAANEAAAVARLRTASAAEVVYASTARGSYADMEGLIGAGLIDRSFRSAVNGYQFTITVAGRNYIAMAIPVSANDGRYGYYVTADGVVRYSRTPGLAPPGQSGAPVQ